MADRPDASPRTPSSSDQETFPSLPIARLDIIDASTEDNIKSASPPLPSPPSVEAPVEESIQVPSHALDDNASLDFAPRKTSSTVAVRSLLLEGDEDKAVDNGKGNKDDANLDKDKDNDDAASFITTTSELADRQERLLKAVQLVEAGAELDDEMTMEFETEQIVLSLAKFGRKGAPLWDVEGLQEKDLSRFKCVVVGDANAGTTEVLTAFTNGVWPKYYIPKVFDTCVTQCQLGPQKLELQLWDMAGQEDYPELRKLSYDHANVFVLCFRADRPAENTFKEFTRRWIAEMALACPGVPIVLVGTRGGDEHEDDDEQESDSSSSDGESRDRANGAITAETDLEGEEYATPTMQVRRLKAGKLGTFKYIYCDARSGAGVDYVFHLATEAAMAHAKSVASRPGSSPGSTPSRSRRTSRLSVLFGRKLKPVVEDVMPRHVFGDHQQA